jgi:hypothetical protein
MPQLRRYGSKPLLARIAGIERQSRLRLDYEHVVHFCGAASTTRGVLLH